MTTVNVGILGAGQLGAFLCESAERLGLSAHVLAESEDDPAVPLATSVVLGSCSDLPAVKQLCERTELITFEREDVSREVLQYLEELADRQQLAVHPAPSIMRLVQDKGEQKSWLVQSGFPTAEFLDCDQLDRQQVINTLGLPLIQKAKRGGFDGRGVQLVDQENLENYWPQGSIAERRVHFSQEIAVLAARDASGAEISYPVIEVAAKPGEQLMDYALAPARLPADLLDKAERLGTEIVAKLNGVGLFAIEMFVTQDKELLVNEISPRVHNTGHLTLEANRTSQFEQHLRAVCGLGLGTTQQDKPAVCRNLLYDEQSSRTYEHPFQRYELDRELWLHWYGKRNAKPLRKMGHLTATATTADAALQHLKAVDGWSYINRVHAA